MNYINAYRFAYALVQGGTSSVIYIIELKGERREVGWWVRHRQWNWWIVRERDGMKWFAVVSYYEQMNEWMIYVYIIEL